MIQIYCSESQLLDELKVVLAKGVFEKYSTKVIDSMEAGLFYKCDGLSADRAAINIMNIIKVGTSDPSIGGI